MKADPAAPIPPRRRRLGRAPEGPPGIASPPVHETAPGSEAPGAVRCGPCRCHSVSPASTTSSHPHVRGSPHSPVRYRLAEGWPLAHPGSISPCRRRSAGHGPRRTPHRPLCPGRRRLGLASPAANATSGCCVRLRPQQPQELRKQGSLPSVAELLPHSPDADTEHHGSFTKGFRSRSGGAFQHSRKNPWNRSILRQ